MNPTIRPESKTVNLIFRHGLGDCVQFTIVLKHLRHYYPNTRFAVCAKPGRETIFTGLADAVFPIEVPKRWVDVCWDQELNIRFVRPTRNQLNLPNSKVTECLLDELGLEPIEALYRYAIEPDEFAEANAANLIKSTMGRGPHSFGLVHFYSECSTEEKNLTENEALQVGYCLRAHGIEPVYLDFANRIKPTSHIAQNRFKIIGAERRPAPRILHELIKKAACFVGIDSGPAHLAAATDTATWVLWGSTCAPYCFDPADNVEHIMPEDWERLLHDDANKQAAADYFLAPNSNGNNERFYYMTDEGDRIHALCERLNECTPQPAHE